MNVGQTLATAWIALVSMGVWRVVLARLNEPPVPGLPRVRSFGTGEHTPLVLTVAAALGSAVVGVIIVGPAGVVGLPAALLWKRRRKSRRVAQRERVEIARLGTLLDLVALSLRSGISLGMALERSCGALRVPEPVPHDPVDELAQALRTSDSIDAGLRRWCELGPDVRREIAELLRASLRSGGHVAAHLERGARSLAQRRKHEMLAQARRLPVRLLVPLVVCTLPAFVAVTVVPLLVVSVRSFALPV